MIAAPDTLYALTCPLMTEDERPVRLVPVFAEAYVSVADAGGDDAYEHLVILWAFHLEELYLQWAAPLAQNGRLNLEHLHIGVASQCPVPP